LHAGKQVGLEVNNKKTKYILISCDRNEVQNHNRKMADVVNPLKMLHSSNI
jgi:uncharacterized protein YlbG (UPF0298 family)